jgi:hypothetical protein
MKTCSRCKKEKSLNMFRKHHKTLDGLTSVCEECHPKRSNKPMPTVKFCRGCEIIKSVEEFYINRTKTGQGLQTYCKECSRNRDRKVEYIKTRKSGNYLRRRLKKYNLTEKGYNDLLIKQNFVCAICKSKEARALAIDHCHETGKVRGLLCTNCNNGLGRFKDNPEYLRRAIKYVIG